MFSVTAPSQEKEPRDYVDEAVGDELAALTGALTVFYLIVSVAHWYLLPRHAAIIMTPLAALSACVLLTTCLLVQRHRLWAQWLHPVAFFVFNVALANCVTHLYLLGRPEDTTNLALLISASGWLTLSRKWLATAATMIWGSWFAVAYFAAASSNWAHFGFFLLGATALGVIIQTARRNMFLRMIGAERDRQVLVDHLEDIIEQRSRDLLMSRDKLRHSERLASIGTLAAGIAHEINNPLGLMMLSVHRIKKHFGTAADVPEVTGLFDDHSEYGHRCARIIKNVLQFAREQPTERWPADINTAIIKAIELTTPYVAERGGTIETSLDPSLPAVIMNPLEVEQVIVNLINNGIEAADASPQVHITTSLEHGMVRLTVSDNGRGLSEDIRAHMFDPFFTTRRLKGGTGLGLSLVYGIVSDHGGTVEAIRNNAPGTTIVVELPIQCESPTNDVATSRGA